MKIPFTATAPALTRAQIDAIVSAGASHPDSSPGIWQTQRSQNPSSRDVVRTREGATRSAQANVCSAAVTAAAYGCVDWYLYPDSHGESESTSEAA